MKVFNFYKIKSPGYKVWCLKFYKHTFHFSMLKVKRKWKLKITHIRLDDLDIIPLYYEVGFLKYKSIETDYTKGKNNV